MSSFTPLGALVLFALLILGSSKNAKAENKPRNQEDFAKLQLTSFAMQDLDFTLLTWKPPTADSYALQLWLNSTEERLQNLKLIIRDADLDLRVGDSIDTIEKGIAEYRQLLSNLRLIGYIDEIAKVEGTQNRWTKSSRVLKALFEGGQAGFDAGSTIGLPKLGIAIGAVVAVGGEGMGMAGEGLERASKYSKLTELKDREIAAQIHRTQTDFTRRIEFLKDTSKSLRERYSTLQIPTFQGNSSVEQFLSEHSDSPFRYVVLAYKALERDRVTSARNFAIAAEKIPEALGPYADVYSTYFVGPYLLLAGHLLEFESRSRADPTLAREAVARFEAAHRVLRPTRVGSTYPYEIAYARALAFAGDHSGSINVATKLELEIPKDPLLDAIRWYDLGCIHASTSNDAKAIECLRKSFSLLPRRDPQARIDPLLSGLMTRHFSTVQLIVDNPLIGEWISTERDKSIYRFYVDGTLWQRRVGAGQIKETKGRWEFSNSSRLVLTGRLGIPDSACEVSLDQNQLQLTMNGNSFRFTRTAKSDFLISEAVSKGETERILSKEGKWKWRDGSEVFQPRFSVTRVLSNKDFELHWYWYEDPLVGRIHQKLERFYNR